MPPQKYSFLLVNYRIPNLSFTWSLVFLFRLHLLSIGHVSDYIPTICMKQHFIT
jgi:hypothetical protein